VNPVTVRPATPGLWVDFGSTGRPADWYQALQAGNTGSLGPVVGVILDCMTGGWIADYQHARRAGLAVMLFQGYWPDAWTGGPAAATHRAARAVQQAQQAGYPAGATIWLDSEAWPSTMPVDAWAQWINTWSTAIRAAGYVDGIYVGAGQPAGVTAQDLYQRLITQHYWRSASAVPDVATRGYQIVQTRLDLAVAGYAVDLDTVHPDALGDLPPAVVPVPAATPAAPASPTGPTLAQVAADLATVQQQVAQIADTVRQLVIWARQGGAI
jgi:hypothetical protein